MNSMARLNGLNEVRDNAMIQDYLKNGGVNLNPAQTAWCAAVVNAALGQTGGQGTGSNMARSFMNWGNSTTQPKPGDIAVFSRGNDPNAGHVGFFQGYDANGNIQLLGGNQGNGVNVSSFAPDGLLGFRTSGQTDQYGPDMGTLNTAKAATAAKPELDNYGKGMQGVTKGLMGLAMATQAPQGGGLLNVPQLKTGPSGKVPNHLRINGRDDDPFNYFA
jgi:uncharacterized protein (TIGR02594 family)